MLLNSVWECPYRVIKDMCKFQSPQENLWVDLTGLHMGHEG